MFEKDEIQYLKGVGPKRASLLKSEYGISSVPELLRVYPFRYIDRSTIQPVASIIPSAAFVQFQATVLRSDLQPQGKKLSIIVGDSSGEIELVFFKGIKFTMERLKPGLSFLFFGKATNYGGKINIVHPDVDPPADVAEASRPSAMTGVYNSSEKLKNAGITNKVMCKIMAAALAQELPQVRETLPDYILAEKNLVSLKTALKDIHFPSSPDALNKAIHRLKFEELFLLQLSLIKNKYVRSRALTGLMMPKVGKAFNDCFAALPYELTGAQKRVIKEIRSDLMSGRQMNRLLQGDVGSGKTMVAVLCCLLAAGNGFQSCIMAPTEVLAQQHFANILKYLATTDVKAALLTGSSKQSERKIILKDLEEGSIGIIVGTHALIEDKVKFKNFGLAIIDEQHRFGVEQRSKLWSKTAGGLLPHVLVMTATPIPRTLAMTVYGDLDVSIIDELPPGRKSVETMLITEQRRASLNKFMKNQIALGRQIFVVYPMIFENEKMDYANMEQGYESIVAAFPFPQYVVGIVHGKQSSDEKNLNMSAFAAGRAHILVSTTVIEVGVDVPNASVMVIESAERFGLSQLHQLRGRVGRGSEKSYCILIKGDKVSKESQKRLELMCSTEDGFVLAEEDMRMRGPGDLEGTQQSGLPVELNIASLAKDGLLLSEARDYAEKILSEDPLLESAGNSRLIAELRKDKYQIKDFSKIS